MPSDRTRPLVLFARGGTSELWLGVSEVTDGVSRPVVLKRAIAGVDDDIEDSQLALTNEARLLAALAHPNIVHVYELIDPPEGLMLVLEYLPGLSLRRIADHLAGAELAMPWPVAARIVADAARGLDHAHRATGPDGAPLHLVHGDVSPENLVVTEEGITKVVDFGTARSVLLPPPGTASAGKAAYVSPEQARGEPLDARSDVFSLGAVLHELCAGRRLFARDGVEATVEAVLRESVPDLEATIPRVVSDVARAMLARERAHRLESAAIAADALEGAIAAVPGTSRDVAAFVRSEFAAPLAFQRGRVRDLVAGAVRARPGQVRSAEGATFVTLEAALGSLTVEPTIPERPPRFPDTRVDDVPPSFGQSDSEDDS